MGSVTLSDLMKVLIACEFSGIIRDAFKVKNHDAVSCDLLPTETPGLHYQWDILDFLNCEWDLMIAHPPCTYLTVTGNRWFKPEYKTRYPDRLRQRKDAIGFFMELANAPIKKIAIENPVSIMSSQWRKPDQIIQPWQFGDKEVKRTCLWLKNLPILNSTLVVTPEYKTYKCFHTKSGKSKYPVLWTGGRGNKKDIAKKRSITFQGIANAMADQWG